MKGNWRKAGEGNNSPPQNENIGNFAYNVEKNTQNFRDEQFISKHIVELLKQH